MCCTFVLLRQHSVIKCNCNVPAKFYPPFTCCNGMQVSSTAFNEDSSRSHTICRFTVEGEPLFVLARRNSVGQTWSNACRIGSNW